MENNQNASSLSSALINSVADLRDQDVLALVRQRIERGDDPLEIVDDCRQGMVEVGKRYEQHQYYLAGLILAGEILREVMEIIQPMTEKKYSGKSAGKILIGTVRGDIHDAGKDLLSILLNVHGFTVIDLGVDVLPLEFLNKARELQPDVVGLSCLLIHAYASMKETIALFRADPQLKDTAIIIGGQVSQEVCKFVGADAWSMDAMDGVRWCQHYLAEHQQK
jgi:methanogenic corrinoid protein MtbC1